MIPIHELLDRIHWDPAFGRGRFALGYYDRVSDEVVVVSMEEIRFEKGDHFAFEFLDEDGETHSVPLHRIRDVYRDGERIWHRNRPPLPHHQAE